MRSLANSLPAVGLTLLLLLATLGEGGGEATALLAWHAVLVGLIVLCLALPRPEPGTATGLAARPLAALALFVGLALLGAARAPYAYAAILVLIELAACLAVLQLAARTGLTRLGVALWPLRIAAAVLGSWAIVQRVWIGDPRPAATFLNPNHMAAWLTAVLLLGLGDLPLRARGRVLAVALALPAAAALVLSGSRGGLAAALVGSSVLAMLSFRLVPPRVRAALVGLLLLLAVLSAWSVRLRMSDHDPFRYHRIQIWRASARAALDAPWWGSGPGQFEVTAANLRFPDGDGPLRYDRMFSATHSDVLRVPAEFGIPAALAALAALVLSVQVVRRNLGGGRASARARAALAATMALATQGLVDNPSRWPSVYLLASCLVGALLAEPRPSPFRVPAPARAALAGLLVLGFVALDSRPTLAWLETVGLPHGRLEPDARERLAAALRSSPWHPEVWLRHAEDLAGDGGDWGLDGYVRAREAAEHAIRLEPADARYYRGLARIEALACRTLFGDVAARERARRDFELAELRSRYDPMIPLELAGFLVDTADAAGARRAAERAFALEPRAVLPRILLADALLEDGSLESAERAATLLDEAVALDATWSGRAHEPYARQLLRLDPRIEDRVRLKLAAVRQRPRALDAGAARLDRP